MNDKIVVCLGKGGQRDMAESFARKTGTSIVEKQGEYLTVLFDSKGVSLTGFVLRRAMIKKYYWHLQECLEIFRLERGKRYGI